VLELRQFIKSFGLVLAGLLVVFLLDPFRMGFLAGYILILSTILNPGLFKKLIDFDAFILFIFSLIYAAVYSFKMEQGVQFLIIYASFPAGFYLIGKRIASTFTTSKQMFYVLFVLSFCFSLTAIVSVVLNLLEGGFVQTNRDIALFWNGKTINATAMGGYLIYNLCVPGFLLLYKIKLTKAFRFFMIITFVVTLLCLFRLGNRTQLVLIVLNTLISLLFIVPVQTKISNLQLIIRLVIVGGIFLLFFPIDPDADYLSVLNSRLEQNDNTATAGGRTIRWTKSIELMFERPFGWEKEVIGYSHNIWLDLARYGGVLMFIYLVLITSRFLSKTLNTIKRSKHTLIQIQLLLYTFVTFIIFFVEPILEGLFHIFNFYCLLQGIINFYQQKINREEDFST
jgi:hypothetical protein